MIPLKLSLEGLFSYRSRQHLDFGPLVEAGLFGILGPTGSGKSALIEAILLALYDRCPRKSGPSIAPIVNRHSRQLYIDFSFRLETASDTTLYRCQYRASISSKGELRDKQHQLYRHEAGQWILVSSKPDEALAQLLGLDYDNFCRAILLPQGKFEDFLLLTPAKRAEALEQLFRLHDYNVYDTIRLELTTAKTRSDELARRAEHLQERTSAEHLQRLKETLERLHSQLEEYQRRIQELESVDRELSRLQNLWEEYEHICARLHALQEQEPTVRHRLRLLQCCLTLQPRWEQLQHLQLECARIESELRHKQQAEEDYRRQLTALQQHYESMRRDYHERHLLYERERHLQDALRYAELHTERNQLAARLQQLEADLDSLRNRRAALQQQLQQCQQRSAELTVQLQASTIPPELSRWYAKKQQLQEASQQLHRELERLREREGHLLQNFSRARLPQDLRSSPVDDIPTLLHILNTAVLQGRTQLEQRRREREELLRRQTAAELAASLTPGHPCPVCGSTLHPQPCSADPAAADRLQEVSRKLEALEHSVRQLESLMTELQSRYDELTHHHNQLRQRLHQLQHEYERHRQAFCWSGWDPDNADQLDDLQRRHAALQEEIHRYNDEGARLQRLLEQLTEEEHTLLRQHAHLCAQLASFDAEAERLRQHLPDPLLQLPPEQLLTELEELHARQHRLQVEYPRLEEHYNQLRQRHERLHLECEHLRSRLTELNTTLQHSWETLRHLCAAEGFSWEEVVTTLQSEPNLTDALQHLRQLEEQYNALRQRHHDLEAHARHYNADAHKRLREELAQARTSATELQQQLGQYREQLATCERELEEYERLRQEQAALSTRCTLLEELERLFRGRAFIQFLAYEYLRALCYHANAYFQQWTHGLLALEVDEKAQLTVRDLSHGGLCRPIHTLSGGQLFQASLAMALALSDMTRASARLRQCLFFIDEGFGNLDRESLGLVMDTLRQLRRHGRLVGLISHREELQQELESYVSIVPDRKHGSRIVPTCHLDAAS